MNSLNCFQSEAIEAAMSFFVLIHWTILNRVSIHRRIQLAEIEDAGG